MAIEHYDVLKPIAEFLTFHDLYVELGVSYGQTFNRVAPLFKRAIAVDILDDLARHLTSPNTELYGNTTTDKFFETIALTLPKADFIWIDADHLFEHSWRDFQNAAKLVKPLTGIIGLHDTYPPDVSMITGGCWTSWQTAISIRSYPDFESITLPGQYGITLCRYVPDGRHLHWMP